MKKFLNILIFCIILTQILTADKKDKKDDKKKEEMRNITTLELTREMGIGINLGNTYEAYGDWVDKWGDGTAKSYYTCWGSPDITQEMIEGYYSEGFRVLRIPVHWFNMMDKDYNISEKYMDAVKQAVDWALDAGLYVIINYHHDERDLLKNMTVTKEENLKNYIYIWEQVAEVFKDYGDHLLFESLNEEGCWNDYYDVSDKKDKKSALNLINEINQRFVDTIRKSGGNNSKRHLIATGYCADVDLTCDPLFKLPKDPMNRCGVSVHYYAPTAFAVLTEDSETEKVQKKWGSKSDIKELNNIMDNLQETFVDNNIAVIVDGYGCIADNKEPESVLNYEYSVTKGIYDRHMVPIIWDTSEFGIYNRTFGIIDDPKLKELFMSIPEDDE